LKSNATQTEYENIVYLCQDLNPDLLDEHPDTLENSAMLPQ
jgi:hypothetical protein